MYGWICLLQELLKFSGKSCRSDGRSDDTVDVVCIDKISDFLDSQCKFFYVVTADLQCGINENIGDVMVGSNDTADKAVKCLSVGDGIFLCIDQADLMRDIKLQFITLFEADDRTVGVVRCAVCHFDQSLGLAGTLEANNQF